MKITLSKFCKKYKLTRYEVLRMIKNNQIDYEIVYKDGVKVYMVEEGGFESQRNLKEVFKCDGALFELEGDRLIMIKDGKKTEFKRV